MNKIIHNPLLDPIIKNFITEHLNFFIFFSTITAFPELELVPCCVQVSSTSIYKWKENLGDLNTSVR